MKRVLLNIGFSLDDTNKILKQYSTSEIKKALKTFKNTYYDATTVNQLIDSFFKDHNISIQNANVFKSKLRDLLANKFQTMVLKMPNDELGHQVLKIFNELFPNQKK